MRIVTYFHRVPKINPENEIRLIQLWEQAWAQHGFQPKVIGLDHAQSHPRFEEYRASISRFKSINPDGYDEACWLRYAAAASLCDKVLMADYDVFPIDFHPDEIPDAFTVYQDNGPCPCLVSGSPSEFERMMDLFMRTDPDPVHWSDMHAIQKLSGNYVQADMVKEYDNTPQWHHKPVIHFPTGRMAPYGLMPKWQSIAKLMQSIRKY